MAGQIEADGPAEASEGGGAAPEIVAPRRTRRPATFTTTPDPAPPSLICPRCNIPLVYRHSVISGVKPIERWDRFECLTCGPFIYRDRTRKLRRTS
jgi:hypothetical protein